MSYAIYPSLKGRPVVITGGGSGIGAEMVGAFARQGARVHFIDVSESDARRVQGALAAEGLHACFRQCDLRDLDAVGTVFAASSTTPGRSRCWSTTRETMTAIRSMP